MPDKEDYQFDECKTCEKFPCYIEGLYQWNGVCMDYKEHIEKPCCEQDNGCSRLKVIVERIELLESRDKIVINNEIFDINKEISELQQKVSNPEWLDILILDLMQPYIKLEKTKVSYDQYMVHEMKISEIKEFQETLINLFEAPCSDCKWNIHGEVLWELFKKREECEDSAIHRDFYSGLLAKLDGEKDRNSSEGGLITITSSTEEISSPDSKPSIESQIVGMTPDVDFKPKEPTPSTRIICKKGVCVYGEPVEYCERYNCKCYNYEKLHEKEPIDLRNKSYDIIPPGRPTHIRAGEIIVSKADLEKWFKWMEEPYFDDEMINERNKDKEKYLGKEDAETVAP